jgi:negative regulator of sigma E activity
MEQQDPMFEESSADQAKAWVQENLRIIVSVFIVAAIALGIYSYSQRTAVNVDDENTLLETKQGETSVTPTEDKKSEGTIKAEVKNSVVVTPELSRETETSFVEQAERGNGTTHLARRALAHYLEKNQDSSLSAEHKVYIEDYLRKNVSFQGTVTTKTSIEFSKDLIKQGIEKSKTLNERQLQNLKKYSSRVSAYN